MYFQIFSLGLLALHIGASLISVNVKNRYFIDDIQRRSTSLTNNPSVGVKQIVERPENEFEKRQSSMKNKTAPQKSKAKSNTNPAKGRPIPPYRKVAPFPEKYQRGACKFEGSGQDKAPKIQTPKIPKSKTRRSMPVSPSTVT